MTEKILIGMPPRCGKTLKSKIEKMIHNMHYTYYEDPTHKSFRNELIEERRHGLNCSEKAPHQEEIEALSALGLSYPVIRKILEQKYY